MKSLPTFDSFISGDFVINTDSPINDYFSKDAILEAPSFATAIETNKMFKESLIASYNVDKFLEKIIKQFGKDRIKIGRVNMPAGIPENLFKTKYDWVFGFVLFIDNFEKTEQNTLNSMLNFFGYHIIFQEMFDTVLKATIEPTHPLIINNLINPLIRTAYHITLSKNIEKINKIGLVPKESKTTFTHKGNRIYLLLSTINLAYGLATSIAQDRKQLLSDYALLSVAFNTNKYTYYMDQACIDLTVRPPLLGCFITTNIPPNEISTISTNMALDIE